MISVNLDMHDENWGVKRPVSARKWFEMTKNPTVVAVVVMEEMVVGARQGFGVV